MDPTPVSLASSMGKNGPSLPSRSGGIARLMVTPRVSGLERSQERSLEPVEPISTSSSTSAAPFSCLKPHMAVPSSVNRPSQRNGLHSRHEPNPPQPKHKPFLMRPPTPSTSMSMPLMRVPGSSGPMRPPSRAASGALYTSPGLPPPPPLLQVPAHANATGRSPCVSLFHCLSAMLLTIFYFTR